MTGVDSPERRDDAPDEPPVPDDSSAQSPSAGRSPDPADPTGSPWEDRARLWVTIGLMAAALALVALVVIGEATEEGTLRVDGFSDALLLAAAGCLAALAMLVSRRTVHRTSWTAALAVLVVLLAGAGLILDSAPPRALSEPTPSAAGDDTGADGDTSAEGDAAGDGDTGDEEASGDVTGVPYPVQVRISRLSDYPPPEQMPSGAERCRPSLKTDYAELIGGTFDRPRLRFFVDGRPAPAGAGVVRDPDDCGTDGGVSWVWQPERRGDVEVRKLS